MNYDELNQTNPYNYFPTGDSAKFELPEDKVTKFRRLWKKHNRKGKQYRKTDSTEMTADAPVSCEPESSDQMISIGGLVGESTLDRYKHLAGVAFSIWQQSHLNERKSSRKGKTKNSSTVFSDEREKKIKKLRDDPNHWKNLE